MPGFSRNWGVVVEFVQVVGVGVEFVKVASFVFRGFVGHPLFYVVGFVAPFLIRRVAPQG